MLSGFSGLNIKHNGLEFHCVLCVTSLIQQGLDQWDEVAINIADGRA